MSRTRRFVALTLLLASCTPDAFAERNRPRRSYGWPWLADAAAEDAAADSGLTYVDNTSWDFNGSNEYATANATTDPCGGTATCTIVFSFKTDQTAASDRIWSTCDTVSGERSGWCVGHNSSSIFTVFVAAGASAAFHSCTIFVGPTDDSWYIGAVRYNSANADSTPDSSQTDDKLRLDIATGIADVFTKQTLSCSGTTHTPNALTAPTKALRIAASSDAVIAGYWNGITSEFFAFSSDVSDADLDTLVEDGGFTNAYEWSVTPTRHYTFGDDVGDDPAITLIDHLGTQGVDATPTNTPTEVLDAP